MHQINLLNSLKLAVVQFTPEFKRKKENLFSIRKLTDGLKADIIILPELCTTGYFFFSRSEVAEIAEPISGPTVAFFKDMALRHNAIVVAGFAERDGNKLYNSSIIVIPEVSETHVYRKIHLFYKERYCFDPGDTGFFVIEDTLRDIRVGPMICYDWRFPESARVLMLLGADLIVCPSNLVTDAWRIVMPARAIENKVYVAVSNRAGTEKRGDETLLFKGNSTIYGYNGMELQKAGPIEDEILQADIYPQKTRDKSFNQINNILNDRLPYHYKELVKENNPSS